MMPLAIPLSANQIRIAVRLSNRLKQGTMNDRALAALAKRFPGFDADATLLKVVALNAIYVTQIYAINRMAKHVQKVLRGKRGAGLAPEVLVEKLAGLPPARRGERVRMNLSFASKFAHVFIDPERFPILDRYAERMVELHLGRRNVERNAGSRYARFVQNLDRLRTLAGLRVSNRDLDRYLWLAGQYRAWRRNRKTPINAELQRLFRSPPPGVAGMLKSLSADTLDQRPRGRH